MKPYAFLALVVCVSAFIGLVLFVGLALMLAWSNRKPLLSEQTPAA